MTGWGDVMKWLISGLTVVALAWAPVSCTALNNERMAEAIKDGAKPMEAHCAYSLNSNSKLCAKYLGIKLEDEL